MRSLETLKVFTQTVRDVYYQVICIMDEAEKD